MGLTEVSNLQKSSVSKAEEKDAANREKGSAWYPEPETKKRMLEGMARAAVDLG